jgi:hypothetical protein
MVEIRCNGVKYIDALGAFAAGELVLRCCSIFSQGQDMSRLTMTLSDDLHQALKETAVRQQGSIGSIIEESLRLRGIKSQADARLLVEQARTRSGLDGDTAMALAVEETGAVRRGR